MTCDEELKAYLEKRFEESMNRMTEAKQKGDNVTDYSYQLGVNDTIGDLLSIVTEHWCYEAIMEGE